MQERWEGKMKTKTEKELEREIEKIEKKEYDFIVEHTGEYPDASTKANIRYNENLESDTNYLILKAKLEGYRLAKEEFMKKNE